METLWYNPSTGEATRFKPDGIDYGDNHLDRNNLPYPGMHKITYPAQKSPIEREIHGSDIVNMYYWPAPTHRGFIEMIGAFRKFILGSRLDRKIILFQKMGFDEVGLAVSPDPDNYLDSLMVYQFSNEPTQIEIFISSHEEGFITEINRYNHLYNREVKIPNTTSGLMFVFNQVYGDMNKVNMNKIEQSMPPKIQEVYRALLDFNSPLTAVDNKIPVEALIPFNQMNTET